MDWSKMDALDTEKAHLAVHIAAMIQGMPQKSEEISKG
jgi:hypothetical protein